MSEFLVDFKGVRSNIDKLNALAGRVQNIADESQDIMSDLKLAFSLRIAISLQRIMLYNKTNGGASQIKFLANAANNALNFYQSYETNIEKYAHECPVGEKYEDSDFANLRDFVFTDTFLDNRNETLDGILFALTRPITSGIKSVINKHLLDGDDMNDEAYKDTIKRMVENMLKNNSWGAVYDGADNVLEIGKMTVDGISNYDDFCKLLIKNGESYKYLSGLSNNSFKNLGMLVSLGQEGVEAAELLINNYVENIAALNAMKEGLKAVNGDARAIGYIDEIIHEYTYKYETIMNNVCEWAAETGTDVGIGVATGAATGGILPIVDYAQSTIYDIMGVTDKGDALAGVYASQHYSDDLVNAYEMYADKLKSGNYTQADVDMCKQMFELAKAAKIDEYTNIQTLCNDAEDKRIISEEIAKLESLQWDGSVAGAFGGGGGAGSR